MPSKLEEIDNKIVELYRQRDEAIAESRESIKESANTIQFDIRVNIEEKLVRTSPFVEYVVNISLLDKNYDPKIGLTKKALKDLILFCEENLEDSLYCSELSKSAQNHAKKCESIVYDR